MKLWVSSLFGLGMLFPSAAFADTVVFSQPGNPASGSQCTPTCVTSSETETGYGYQSYDQFWFASTTEFNAVSWQGFYFDGVTPSNDPVPPNTLSWQLGIYANNSGAPGTLLYSETVPQADVQTTFLGNGQHAGTVGVYSFELGLGEEFSAAGGTTYFISPVSIINASSNNPEWVWSGASTYSSGTVYQQEINAGSVVASGSASYDQAFSLIQTPEPAGVGPAALGLLAVFGFSKRRRFGLKALSGRPSHRIRRPL